MKNNNTWNKKWLLSSTWTSIKTNNQCYMSWLRKTIHLEMVGGTYAFSILCLGGELKLHKQELRLDGDALSDHSTQSWFT